MKGIELTSKRYHMIFVDTFYFSLWPSLFEKTINPIYYFYTKQNDVTILEYFNYVV